MISAANTGGSYRANKNASRRGTRPAYDPIYNTAKTIADQAFEDAQRLIGILAPDRPADADALNDYDQFQILELAAVTFSPGYWDDPEALTDLYRLKKQFTGRDDPHLLEYAKAAKERNSMLPPPEMTPRNPKWDETVAKLKGASNG